MEKQKKHRKLYEPWLYLSIKQKLYIFAGAVVLAIGLAIISNFLILNYALFGFGNIMDDNVKSYAFLEAVGQEAKAFETYVRTRSDDDLAAFEAASLDVKNSVEALPFQYGQIGPTRYAKTWSIRSFYQNYVIRRDQVLGMDEEHPNYLTSLYQVYRLQDYLDMYARRLMQLTMQEGNDDYLIKAQTFRRIPVFLVIGAVIIVSLVVFLTILMWRAIVNPVGQMAHFSRRIAKNDFPEEDLIVENQDEIGELVRAFNKMKHATIGYIRTLEEKHEITQLLHKEELERVEMEKNLEASRLEVLKSQINPHFLFNTLNMIACMAKLEDADVTDKMINSMSNLFRYNLKTTESEVLLKQELKIVDDYMYLQKMRFGNRIQYGKKISPEAMDIMIPSFSLQPIVENAILHGLAKKEQGGKLFVKAIIQDEVLAISIIDTGVGMDEDSLRNLQEALTMKTTSRIGIGLGNIYKRIHMMYNPAELKIFSKKGMGTMIRMKIPRKQWDKEQL